MPVYQLIPEVPLFPPTEEAEEDGLLAIGGDLTKERLLAAYSKGIFPWYEVGQPILWWSPDPRLVLIPEELKISRSLRKVLRKQQFEIRFDTAFQQVIKACADVRTEQGEGTWIIAEMQAGVHGTASGWFCAFCRKLAGWEISRWSLWNFLRAVFFWRINVQYKERFFQSGTGGVSRILQRGRDQND